MAKSRRTLSGHTQLIAVMRKLREAPKGRALDEAGMDAMVPLRDATNARARRKVLVDSAAIAKVRSVGSHLREFWVGFKRGDGQRVAHLVELGTAPHSMAKGASRRYGIMQDVPPFHPGTPPEPFFRPAYESTHDEVLRRASRNLWNIVVRSFRGGRMK